MTSDRLKGIEATTSTGSIAQSVNSGSICAQES
jgi:hypothetical protein